MNQPLNFVLPAVLVAFCFILPLGQGSTDGCLISSTECYCAPKKPEGTCLRYRGNGTCVARQCELGFRCDCLGFETCSVTQCNTYAALLGETKSENVPFRCGLQSGNAQCIALTGVQATGNGARNAEAYASAGNDDVIAAELFVVNELDDMLQRYNLVSQMLRDVWRFAVDVPPLSLQAMQSDSTLLIGSMGDMARLVEETVLTASSAADMLSVTRGFKRLVVLVDAKLTEKKKALKTELEKADKDMPTIAQLQKEVEQLELDLQNAAVESGKAAQRVRIFTATAGGKIDDSKEVTSESLRAMKACMEKVKASLISVGESTP